MDLPKFKRIPKHIGIIPDGNRRWAQGRGMGKEAGYAYGIDPGFQLYELCLKIGIQEMTFYGFTSDNTKRPAEQRIAFQQACVDAVKKLSTANASLLVIGNSKSPHFPPELKEYTQRKIIGNDVMRINFLVNYDWNWDLSNAMQNAERQKSQKFMSSIASSDISRIDLIIRWGGRRRLSGLLPVQSVYSDFYVVDELWPDFQPEHLFAALRWYQNQDITLGG